MNSYVTLRTFDVCRGYMNMECGYIRNLMKSKLPKEPGESHQQYMKRIADRERERTAQKFARRRRTIEYFAKVAKGEITYKQPTNPLPAGNAKWKGRIVQFRQKTMEMK